MQIKLYHTEYMIHVVFVLLNHFRLDQLTDSFKRLSSKGGFTHYSCERTMETCGCEHFQ